ncbi:MAG TPA: hypothetical protein VM029_01525 [Opitutaceae bacterium]|nr:hypothetical protein [Opitutaceae bacterium]
MSSGVGLPLVGSRRGLCRASIEQFSLVCCATAGDERQPYKCIPT